VLRITPRSQRDEEVAENRKAYQESDDGSPKSSAKRNRERSGKPIQMGLFDRVRVSGASLFSK
jgi:hypothetical protein